MNLWRQRQSEFNGWQARLGLQETPSDQHDDRLKLALSETYPEKPLPLTPHECPARVGGMAGDDERKKPCVHQNPPVFLRQEIDCGPRRVILGGMAGAYATCASAPADF